MVEMLVAIMVLGLGLSAAYASLVQASRMNRASRDAFQAIALAENDIERLRQFVVAELDGLEEPPLRVNDEGKPDPDGLFRRQVRFEKVAEGLVKATVEVEILDPFSRKFEGRSRRASTLLADLERAP